MFSFDETTALFCLQSRWPVLWRAQNNTRPLGLNVQPSQARVVLLRPRALYFSVQVQKKAVFRYYGQIVGSYFDPCVYTTSAPNTQITIFSFNYLHDSIVSDDVYVKCP